MKKSIIHILHHFPLQQPIFNYDTIENKKVSTNEDLKKTQMMKKNYFDPQI
ncbi:protein of unknown function [Chryseobacterium sp. JV274]|nr:protein of unknown function [Chryseobacterium sp. JV274]